FVLNVSRCARLAAVSAAGLVLLAPATAHAYEAEDYTTSISSPSIPAGGSFTVVTQGPEGNPEITLTLTSNPASIPSSSIVIAGTKSLRKATDAGVAEFTVTLSEPGKYTVVPTDVDGVVLTTQTVTVLGEDGSESDDD